MSILTNWIFWIIVCAIVLLLAIVGYLSESRKKSEKVLNNENNISNDKKDIMSSNSSDAINEAPNVSSNAASLDDWSIMPEVSSISNDFAGVNSDSIVGQTVSEIPVVEQPVSASVEQAPVVEQPASASVEQASVVEPTIQSSFIEPNSVFNSNIGQVDSNPVPIPAEPSSAPSPAPIPSDLNVANNPQPQSSEKNDIETL